MTPPTAKARVVTPGPATSKTAAAKPHDHREGTPPAWLVAALAVLLRAAAGATFDRAMVKTCPFGCGYVHIHHVPVGGPLDGLVRAPRCAPWRRYRLEIVAVAPPLAVAGQRRRSA